MQSYPRAHQPAQQRPRILIVDDEPTITEFLRVGLGYEGFETKVVASGEAALEVAREFRPDLVVLDIMLPGISGVEVCRRLRLSLNPCVLMLTAKREVEDRVEGLEAGADDYLVKPFAFEELLARVRALLRRAGRTAAPILRVKDVTLNRETRQVTRAAAPIDLTRREFDLLELFMSHPGRVFDRSTVLNVVWGYDYDGSSNVVEVYVGYLRRKLGDPEGHLIRTARGVGYAIGE